jgi:hypothetical protein
MWVPVYYRYWAHMFLLSPNFLSLSPPDVSELFLSAKPNGYSTRRAPIPNHHRSSERNNFNPKTISKDFLPHHPHPCLPSLHFLPGFLFISHKPKLHFLKKKQKKRKSMKTHIPFCTLVTAFLKNPVTESLED